MGTCEGPCSVLGGVAAMDRGSHGPVEEGDGSLGVGIVWVGTLKSFI